MKQVTIWLAAVALGMAARAEVVVFSDQFEKQTLTQTVETKTVKTGTDSSRSESVTRTQLGTDRMVETERATSVTETVRPGTTRTTRQVEQLAGRAGELTGRRTTEETTTKTDAGESRETVEYQRLTTGELVMDRSAQVTTTTQPDGSRLTRRVEKERDLDNAMAVQREVTTRTVQRSANEEVSSTSIRSKNKMTGRFEETAREESTTRTQSNTVRTESALMQQGDGAWRVTARVEVSETRGADGTMQRETIRHQLPEHAQAAPTATESLRPQWKIVERLTPAADGRSVLKREVYRRDVNNEWVPVTRSSPFK